MQFRRLQSLIAVLAGCLLLVALVIAFQPQPTTITSADCDQMTIFPSQAGSRVYDADFESFVPADLPYAVDLVRCLHHAGITAQAVAPSVQAAWFTNTNRAAWIETSNGIVDAVFFDSRIDNGHVTVVELPATTEGFHRYQLRGQGIAGDGIIEGMPLYFTLYRNVLMTTADPELDQGLKRIFARK